MAIDKVAAILGAAAAVAKIIELVADMLGEPLVDVRKGVLAQCVKDAADPTDETDTASSAIDADLPGDPEPPVSSER